ncbi:MAG: hypothetical protein WCK43_04080 [bacterium]
MSSCQKCGNDLEAFLSTLPNKKTSRQDTCPKCHADLKICINCEFYDSSRKWECKEGVSERVADKERSNFCDFFSINQKQANTSSLHTSKNDLLSAAEALFKKNK